MPPPSERTTSKSWLFGNANSPGSIQPQLRNILRIGFQLTLLHALDEIGEHRVGAARHADFLALAHDQPVQEFDLGAAALLHVLAHRRALAGRGASGILDALFVAGVHRRLIAFAGARDGFGWNVQNFLELIAERLSGADRFGADARRETTDRLALEHVAAAQAGAGGKPVLHGI